MTHTMTVVGTAYAPFVIGQVGVQGISPMDLLLQMPILGILAYIVWLFLKHQKDQQDADRTQRQVDFNERQNHQIELEKVKSEALRHINDDCHAHQLRGEEVQKLATDALVRVAERELQYHETQARTLILLERLDRAIDRTNE